MKKIKMAKSADLLSIVLHHNVNAEGQLYRLKRGTKLRLVPGSTLLGKYVALYCNYPVTGEQKLSRIRNPKSKHSPLIYCFRKS